MDIVFKCTNKQCEQELAVDAAGAGSEIECPTCGEVILVPEATPQNGQGQANVANLPPPTSPTPPRAPSKPIQPAKGKHFAVPMHSGPVEGLIKKPKPTLEVAAKESDKEIRLKTIRHS